jgi:hypothetical protein
MSVGTLIKALVKHKTGKISAPEFRMLRVKHLKRGEKLPTDFLNRANRVKRGEKLPKGSGQKPKANTKLQEEIARGKAVKTGSKTMKKDTKRKPIVKKLGGGSLLRAAAKAVKKIGKDKDPYEKEIRRLHKIERGLKGQALIKNKKQQLNLMNKQMKLIEGSKSAGSVTRKLAEKKADDAKKLAGKKVKRAGGGTLARAFLKGTKALRGNTKSATRLNEAGETVRAAKEVTGAAKQVGDKVDKAIQGSSTAKRVRKGEGKTAADLQQPSGGSLGKTAEMRDAGIPKYMIDAYNAKGYDEALKTKIEELTRAKLARKKATKDKDVRARAKSEMKYGPDFNKTYLLNSIQDMIERGGPGGRSKTNFKRKGIKRKAGGPVVKRKTSGPTKPKVKTPDWMKGLSPAQIQEIKGGPLPSGYRSGKKIKKKPSKVRKAKAGGPVVKRYGGGKVIKSNRSGNDLVASCYD